MNIHFSYTKQYNHSKINAVILASFALIIGVVLLSFSFWPSTTKRLETYELESEEFEGYIKKYNKAYETKDEHHRRFLIYRDNSAYIRLSNTLNRDWTLGVNSFTDLTIEEFKEKYLLNSKTPAKILNSSINLNLTLPASVDWSLVGAVTPVKNAGKKCAASWAFSAAGAIESAWKIAGNPLVPLSEQQLIDCSTSYGNQGCLGGSVSNAFGYVKAQGITSQEDYPYKDRQDSCDKKAEEKVIAKITGFSLIAQNSKNSLMAAVTSQPVSVAVDASTWAYYAGGVITGNCGTQLNFAALVVGYNTVPIPNWWKVKNIWGTDWGTAGYVFIGIADGNGICGINMEPLAPIV